MPNNVRRSGVGYKVYAPRKNTPVEVGEYIKDAFGLVVAVATILMLCHEVYILQDNRLLQGIAAIVVVIDLVYVFQLSQRRS